MSIKKKLFIFILLFILFILYILNFYEHFTLLSNPSDIINYCTNNPNGFYNAPTLISIFNCTDSPNIINAQQDTIILSPITVCPIGTSQINNKCIFS